MSFATTAIVGAGAAGVGALGKGLTGLFQGLKARRIEKNNVRPTQVVQNEYLKNVSDAEQAARLGMPLQQYQQAQQNQQRNFNGVVNALGRSANSSAGLSGLLRAQNDAALNLDVNNAQQRVQNQRYLAQQRNILGQQKQDAFDWNQKSKYLADLAQSQGLRGASQQNLMGAFNDFSQIGTSLASGGLGFGGGGSVSPSLGTQQFAPAGTGARLSNYNKGLQF